MLSLWHVWLKWKRLRRIPDLWMLRRVIVSFPGPLQLAVTRVGQFPTCIPHGNKALNLFSWKQLVVSQTQMPTCVLTANLLDVRWINYRYYYFRSTLLRAKQREAAGFVFAAWVGCRREGPARQSCNTADGWGQELAGLKVPLFGAQALSEHSFPALPEMPFSLSVHFVVGTA